MRFIYSQDKKAAQALSLLIFFGLIVAALLNPQLHAFSMGTPAAVNSARPKKMESSADPNADSRARDAFGRLPLSFAANRGQADQQVRFLTRGQDYGLFLTADGAVFSFKDESLRMRLQGAAATARVSGLDELPGKVNYLLGNKPGQWLTNISTYARVRYEGIYDGVDLIYYGNERQLEYDFEVAPYASIKQIRLNFEGGKLKLSRGGDLVWQAGERQLTLLKPRAYQEIGGQRRPVAARYVLTADSQVGFQLGNYDRTRRLVIDPKLSYSTYLGGSGSDQAQSIAVDSSGNAYLTGQTNSTNFPATPATPANGTDVFVTKLNAAGTAVVYSTVIGGSGADSGKRIACDTAGNAYVVGQTSSSDFPVVAALHPNYGGSADAFVLELNASGSAPVFSTFLGGRGSDAASSVAIDSAANVYVSGATSSSDFPTTNPLQAHRAGNSIFKTTDAAGNWTASDSGLSASVVTDLIFDPSNASVLYAATDGGIFKSTDAGAHWNALTGQPAVVATRLAIDPSNPNIIYTAGNGGVFKSSDGGNSFTAINNGINPAFANSVAIDPVTPATVYAVGVGNSIFKSTDGGATWSERHVSVVNITVNTVSALLIDPNTPATIYAATNRGVFKSTNAADSWTLSSTGFPSTNFPVNALALDRTNNLLYAATTSGVFKSSNAAGNWTNINGNLPPLTSSRVALDPTNSSLIYQVANGLLFKTIDGGATWTLSNTGIPNNSASAVLVNPMQPTTLYLASVAAADAFITKLSPGGAAQVYSTFLGGDLADSANGIATDASGNAYMVGNTSSLNFPTVNPIQPARDAASADAFVAKLNASGSALVYSTFLGGNSNENGRAIAVDASGNAYVTGNTLSSNFPTANALQATNPSFSSEAFVTKINPAGSALVYSTYLGGGSIDDAFDIAVDAMGSAYVVGMTASFNFPVAAAFQPILSGPSDAFVTKFAPNGQTLLYSTYLGGSNAENGFGLALDASKNVYVVGSTASANFPTLNPLQAANGGFTDAFVAKLIPAPELGLTISDAPDPVFWGEELTYTINVTNNGDATATGVTVGDTLPEGSTLVSANTSTGPCTGTQAITCPIGTLAPGAAATVTLIIKPPPVATVNNTAFATLNETDAFPPNNIASTQTVVKFADLALIKNAPQSLVAPGGKITYSLLAKNLAGIATPVTVTDVLPAGTSLIKCAATGTGVCGGSGNNVTVQIPSLAPNQSEAILLTVGVSASATPGTVITNSAVISSPVPDIDIFSNSSTASVTVATVPVLQKSNGLIAFAADRAFTPVSEPSGIYTVKPDGIGETLFPNVPLNAWRPAWSPDGSKLAFQRFVGIASQISVINADGTNLTPIVGGVGFRKTMSWSPNGKQIAYINFQDLADLDDIESIHIANADGSGAYKLPGSPKGLNSVDWSPDGSKFAYSNGSIISVINADGTGITPLTTVQMTDDGATHDTEPHWSPDGTRIIFTRSTNNSNAIYTVNADGTNVARLFNFGGLQADWSPDGLSVVLQQSNEICTANIDGSNFKCLTNNIYYEFDPHWQELPTASPTPTPSPSPTFSISGTITASGGAPLAVQVQITGPVSRVSASDSFSGLYTFANLPAGEYTVTPLSIFHTFAPPSRIATITNANVTGENFVGTFVTANIAGHVRDNDGNPLSGIKVTSTGGVPARSVFTDATGFYSFANVQRGATYVIQPDPFTAYNFVPSSKTFSDLISSQVVDFVGTKQPSNVIAGRVIETSTGLGLAGIQINLAQDFVPAATVVTDANGNFTFGERQSNRAYTVTTDTDPTFDFEPNIGLPSGQISIPSLTSDQNLIFNAARRNTIQFASSSFVVAENAGSREIVVTRSGDVASPALVTYATSDTAGLAACTVVNGKASERCDYETAVGTLRFAAGETSKSFIVPIVDDAHVEGSETLSLTLVGPVGAKISLPVAVLTITDNDASPSAQNPIDDIPFFVTQQYIDFLGRLPDTIGFNNWVATLQGCPNGGFGENDNPDCDRVHVSAGFFLSDEFRGRGYWAYRFYEVGFDRRPLYAEFVPDMAQVGGPQSPQSELLSKAAYTAAFVVRPEFTARYNGLSNSAYVNALEQNAEITLANKAALVAALNGNQKTRADVLREIVESKDVEDRFFIRAFVAMQYFGYLRRDPDTIGYNNWVTTLTADPSNFRHMIFGFLYSTEYRGRFGNN